MSAELRSREGYRYREALCTDAGSWDTLLEAGSCELEFTIYDPAAWGAERVSGGDDIEVAGTRTGAARIVAGEYKVVVGRLFVRSTPSRRLAPVAQRVRSNRIHSVAADAVAAEGYVWAHYVARSGMVRHVALGTSDGSERYLVKG